jgi:hypothetical protein
VHGAPSARYEGTAAGGSAGGGAANGVRGRRKRSRPEEREKREKEERRREVELCEKDKLLGIFIARFTVFPRKRLKNPKIDPRNFIFPPTPKT